MSIWKRLFGEKHAAPPALRELRGRMYVVPKEEVEALGTQIVASAIDLSRKDSASSVRLHTIELAIDGYNNDPRDLYQIPEVAQWFQHVFTVHEELHFWLAPGPLQIFLLACFPETWHRRPDGAVEMLFDPKVIGPKREAGMIRAATSLSGLGLDADQIRQLARESQQNYEGAVRDHTLGREYIVVAPDAQTLTKSALLTQEKKEDLLRDAHECFLTAMVRFIRRKEAGETFSKEEEFAIPFDSAVQLLADKRRLSHAEASVYVQESLLKKPRE